MRRLARAMDAFLAYPDGPDAPSRDEFLAAHADVRDLLEPMLGAGADPDPIDPGVAGSAPIADALFVRGDTRQALATAEKAHSLLSPRNLAERELIAGVRRSLRRFRDAERAAAPGRPPTKAR